MTRRKNKNNLSNNFENNENQLTSKVNPKLPMDHPVNQKASQMNNNQANNNFSDSSEDEDLEEEDEQGELISKEVEGQFIKTLMMIQSKDQKVYDPETQFFEEELFEQARNKWKNKQDYIKQQAPVTLRQMEMEQLLNPSISTESYQEPMTHVEEQRKIKDDLKNAINDIGNDDEDDDLFSKKPKSQTEIDEEDAEYKDFLLGQLRSAGVEESTLNKWQSGPSVAEADSMSKDDQDTFLMSYILNRGWVSKGQEITETKVEDTEAIKDLEASEEELEIADEFEQEYNFRFEEPNSGNIISHPRTVEGTLRRVKSARAQRRADKQKRKEETKAKKAEELKRLKNQKKKQILEQLEKLQSMSGYQDYNIEGFDLDEDFDPEKFDQQMHNQFDDEYYDGDDFGDNEKPEFNDDVDIGDIERGQSDKDRKEVQRLMNEYYNLNYEDIIDGTPVRYKYRSVEADFFGLTPEEILMGEEKELNQVVPLKKLAPYRKFDSKLRPNYKNLKEFRDNLREQKNSKNKNKNKNSSKQHRSNEASTSEPSAKKAKVKKNKQH